MAAGITIFIILAVLILHSSAQHQCNDVNYRDESDYESSESDVPVCFMLSDGLEKALLSSLNLYRLRRVFYPNDAIEPILVTVTYKFQIDATSVNNTCPGVNENNTIEFLNATESFVWTSSVVFSRLHPEVIDWLLPSLLYVLNPISNTYFNTTSSSETVLILDVSSLSCIPSSDQVKAVLEDLTTMLKAYANVQGLINVRERAIKGYVIHGKAYALAYVAFFIPMTVLILTVTSLYTRVIVTHWVHEHLKKVSNAQKPDYQIFLSTYISTAIVNWGFVGFELGGYIAWTIKSHDGDVKNEDALITVFFKFLIVLIMASGAAGIASIIINCAKVTTQKKQTDTQPEVQKEVLVDLQIVSSVPIELRDAALFFALAWCYIGKKSEKINFLILKLVVWNFLCFALLITWCLIPVIIIVFITPIQTLAIVFLLLSIFFLFAASIAVGFLAIQSGSISESTQSPTTTSTCKSIRNACTCNRALNTIVTLTICIIFLFIIVLYLYLVRSGIGTGGVLGIAVSFVPGAITAAMALLSKKLLDKYRNPKTDAEPDRELITQATQAPTTNSRETDAESGRESPQRSPPQPKTTETPSPPVEIELFVRGSDKSSLLNK